MKSNSHANHEEARFTPWVRSQFWLCDMSATLHAQQLLGTAFKQPKGNSPPALEGKDAKHFQGPRDKDGVHYL